jgi:hypothetical protein
MAKIKNPTLFSTHFKIDPGLLRKHKIFDPVLNVDTQLFIDPLLLRTSKSQIISKRAVEMNKTRYENIISLLSHSSQAGDFAWKKALNLIPKEEVEGTCLGYGTNSISGRRLSDKIRFSVINTANEILKIGIKDPDLFMLLPLFEEGIGPDSISDMTTSAIEDALIEFTFEAAKLLNIKTQKVSYKGTMREIIKNPLKSKVSPILLLPEDILRHLPIVNSWHDIADAASFNNGLRMRVNQMISDIFRAKTKQEKARVKRDILRSKGSIEQLLKVVKLGNVHPYNFEKDNLGLLSWQNILTNIADQNPLKIESNERSEESLKEIVNLIIEQFKFLIEERGLNKLLWKSKNEPNKEKVVQMLFFGVAYSYCKANNVDINPEMDTGNGIVDFKFSRGFTKRLIVEVKNSYNQNIVNGFKIQLESYKRSEETCFGLYIIVDVGGLGKKYDSLLSLYNSDKHKKAEIFYINGEIKPTASKRTQL